MRHTTPLAILLALIVATMALFAAGCDSNGPADRQTAYEFRMPDGRVERTEFSTLFSPVEQTYLTPDQWHTPEHQEALQNWTPQR